MTDWNRYLREHLPQLGVEPARESDIIDELSQHLADREADARTAGATEDRARAAALAQMDDLVLLVTRIQKADRPRPAAPAPPPSPGGRFPLTGTARDVRYAIRTLWRAPRFAAAAIGTLAVALGAGATVFAVVSGVLLEPLPYPQPDRLVRILRSEAGYLSGRELAEYRDQSRSIEAVAAIDGFRTTGTDLTGWGAPRRVTQLAVSAGYFEVLGAKAIEGRTFNRQDERADARQVIISARLAREMPVGKQRPTGSPITLDGRVCEVVGVLPPGFRDPFERDADVWIPVVVRTSYGDHYLNAIGRLAPEASLDAANAELAVLTGNLAGRRPQAYRDRSVLVTSLHDQTTGASRTMLLILLAFVTLVLVVAAVNVANLVLARGVTRDRELAVRVALGAGRFQVIRQTLVEGLVLAAAGGIVGSLLAAWSVRALVALRPEALPRIDDIGFDWRVLLCGAGAVIVVAMVASLPAALRAARRDPERSLRAGATTLAGPARHRWVRAGLVAAQIGIAVVVLSVASLLVESFVRLSTVDLGFRPSGITTFEVGLPTARYETGTARQAFYQRMAERLAASPGVNRAGMVSKLPVSGRYNTWGFQIEGRSEVLAGEPWGLADVRCVGGQYFDALGVRLERGRLFEPTDDSGGLPVAVISRSMARKYWGGSNPIGARFRFGDPRDWRTVVGVVADLHHDHREAPAPTAYLPHAQIADDRNWVMTQVVRAPSVQADLPALVRRVVRDLDLELIVHDVEPLSAVVARDVARSRFSASLMVAFGVLVLLIAAAGVYAVVSCSVSERTREIGLRMALGAGRADVRRMVIRTGTVWVALGVLAGVPAAVAASRLIVATLADARPLSLLAAGTAVVVLAAAAAVASYWPARRAIRIDPIVALRAE